VIGRSLGGKASCCTLLLLLQEVVTTKQRTHLVSVCLLHSRLHRLGKQELLHLKVPCAPILSLTCGTAISDSPDGVCNVTVFGWRAAILVNISTLQGWYFPYAVFFDGATT
jgi:hypothetical protein